MLNPTGSCYSSHSVMFLVAQNYYNFLLWLLQIRIRFLSISAVILNKTSVNRNRAAWSCIVFFMVIWSQEADEAVSKQKYHQLSQNCTGGKYCEKLLIWAQKQGGQDTVILNSLKSPALNIMAVIATCLWWWKEYYCDSQNSHSFFTEKKAHREKPVFIFKSPSHRTHNSFNKHYIRGKFHIFSYH